MMVKLGMMEELMFVAMANGTLFVRTISGDIQKYGLFADNWDFLKVSFITSTM